MQEFLNPRYISEQIGFDLGNGSKILSVEDFQILWGTIFLKNEDFGSNVIFSDPREKSLTLPQGFGHQMCPK